MIKIPNTVDIEGAQRIIDYIQYQEITSKSDATQEAAEKLADKVNREWWNKIRTPFSNDNHC